MFKRLIPIILVLFSLLYADEIDDKMRELQNINSRLEKTEQDIKKTADKKKKTEGEIYRTSSLKKQTERNVRSYQQKEKALSDSLSSISNRLLKANEHIGYLRKAQEESMNLLLRVDRSFKAQQIGHRDHRYLKSLILEDNSTINTLKGYRTTLELARDIHGREASKVARNLRNETQKNQKYDSDIKNLTNQSKQLDKEEKALQQLVASLRKDASDLQSLINRLMADSGRMPQSYEFTQIKILWPVRGRILRSFGQETRSYNTSVVSNGIDIAVKEGSNVVAVDDGEVIFSDRYGAQGKLVIIDHKNGYFSLYGYNKDLLVQRGAKVKRGQTIAKSGATGSANEPSLHFELRKDGRAINPLPFFE